MCVAKLSKFDLIYSQKFSYRNQVWALQCEIPQKTKPQPYVPSSSCAYRMFAPCCPGTAYQVYAWWVVRSPVEHRLVGLVCHATNYFTRIISFLICHLNDDDSRVATTPHPASLSSLPLHVGKLCNIA